MEIRVSFESHYNKPDRKDKGHSLLTHLSDYVVLDLETTGLDPTWNEIIEIGAIRVRDNSVVDSFSQLVKPLEPVDDFISELTGITNDMLEEAPRINTVLPLFLDFVGEDIVIGHNVNFDINFLYDNCQEYLSKPFTNDFVDTMRISKRLFPEERHHRLSDLEKRFNLQSSNAHRALSDVILTNQCYEYMLNYMLEKDITFDSIKNRKNQKNLSAKDIVATSDNFDINSPVFNKVFVFTGTLDRMPRKDAMQIVVNLGGSCGDTVTRQTNYLVLGNYDYCTTIKEGKSTKLKKAERLMLDRNDIEIISENVFYDMIEDNSDDSISESADSNGMIANESNTNSNALSTEDTDSFVNYVKETIEDILKDEPAFAKQIAVSANKDKSISIKAKNNLVIRIIQKADLFFIQFKAKYDPAFHSQTIESLKDETSQIIAESKKQLSHILSLACEVAIEIISEYGGESFGCCSRYLVCSDERKCVHPDRLFSRACSYRKNLEKGRRFYGKNRNID